MGNETVPLERAPRGRDDGQGAVGGALWFAMGDVLLGRRLRQTDPAVLAHKASLSASAPTTPDEWHETVPGMGP